ncbi:36373_t:CDS:2, partial [Gigaspora margarita]
TQLNYQVLSSLFYNVRLQNALISVRHFQNCNANLICSTITTH